jgi:hypothetical protein
MPITLTEKSLSSGSWRSWRKHFCSVRSSAGCFFWLDPDLDLSFGWKLGVVFLGGPMTRGPMTLGVVLFRCGFLFHDGICRSHVEEREMVPLDCVSTVLSSRATHFLSLEARHKSGKPKNRASL